MTKEELAAYEIKPLSEILPYWDQLSTMSKAVVESAFNLEWWRGYHAPRPATMRHVPMGQPAPEGDTHIILGAEDYERWRKRWAEDRRDHGLALRDAISETARTVDELAFYRYQAIYWRAYAYDARLMSTSPVPEDEETWRTAERDLEAARVAENRERYAHAEPGRDPGAT